MFLRSRVGRVTRPHSVGTGVAQAVGLSFVVLAVAVAFKPQRLAARSADPTFAEDVAPILYKNCAGCHRPGGIGPFSVLNYDTVNAHVDQIRDAVDQGIMPPWHADGPHGVFSNDRRLSDADKSTIVRWADAGAKPGDMKDLPPQPDYPSKWTIGGGRPDLVLGMNEDFQVPASGTIDYQYFRIPTNLTEDKWVKAIEIMPGAREVVHHVLVYAYVPPSPSAAPQTPPAAPAAGAPRPQPVFIFNRAEETTPPDPPRQDSLHAPPRPMGTLIASMAPGTSTQVFPEGTALRLRAGTVLTFQMHYTAHGHAMTDRTMIGFKFANEMPDEEIHAAAFINGAFTLPAGAKDIPVTATLATGQAVRIWGLLPHTHLRGVRWHYDLQTPDGTSEVILDVPHYDFNWQTYYMFAKPLDLPAGSKIVSTAWYDNSVTNKHNPDPTKDVHWGDQTWEEMQYTGFLYTIPSRRLKPAPGQ